MHCLNSSAAKEGFDDRADLLLSRNPAVSVADMTYDIAYATVRQPASVTLRSLPLKLLAPHRNGGRTSSIIE